MRFVTFQRRDYPEAGLWIGDEIISLEVAGFRSMLQVIGGGMNALNAIYDYRSHAPSGEIVKAAGVRWHAPIPRPSKIICVGLNYRDHAKESNLPIPDVPTIFAKFPTAALGHRQPVVLPKASSQCDWEAEFAFVIGRGGRYIPEERWREHVFGYTIMNDVSARDFQMATSQWIIGKTFDTFAPFGPAIVTTDEIPDPHALDISLTLNGEIMQSSNTCNLIFNVPRLIAYLSSVFTLEAGDVVTTGTPAGVGFARKPSRFLKRGDFMVARIEGLGELVNPVVAEE